MGEATSSLQYPSVEKPWLKYYSNTNSITELPEESIYNYIWNCNKNRLNHTMLSYIGTKISGKKFFSCINSLINAFTNEGLKKGDTVTLMSLLTPETIYCIYALNYLGVVINCINFGMAETEIQESISITKSKLLITLDIGLGKINKIIEQTDINKIVVLKIEDSFPVFKKIIYKITKKREAVKSNLLIQYKKFINQKKIEISAPLLDKDDVSFLLYTSGSTGKPKCVPLSNVNINQTPFQYKISGMKYEEDDVCLSFLPLYLSVGLCLSMHMPLCLGMRLDIYPFPVPELLAKHFKKIKPNHFFGDPYHVEKIISSLKGNASYIKTIAVGGNSPTKEQEERINKKLEQLGSKVKLITGYGMTELSATSITEFNHVYKEGSIGIPLPLCNIKIVDPENERELSYDQVGELLISSPGQTQGYFNNSDENKLLFSKDKNTKWIKTGDLVSIDKDGFLYFKGRLKRIYIKNDEDGSPHKIYPQRIEKLLEENRKIKECAVIVAIDEDFQHKQIAFVSTTKPFTKDDIEVEIYQFLRNRVSEYMIPEQVFFVSKVPRLENGKIDYPKLEKWVEQTM